MYEPANLSPNPPIITLVSKLPPTSQQILTQHQLHTCGGTASVYHGMTSGYKQFADQKAAVLIYPETKRDMNCRDINRATSLRHGGGGDSQTVANMVQYTFDKHAAPSSRAPRPAA